MGIKDKLVAKQAEVDAKRLEVSRYHREREMEFQKAIAFVYPKILEIVKELDGIKVAVGILSIKARKEHIFVNVKSDSLLTLSLGLRTRQIRFSDESPEQDVTTFGVIIRHLQGTFRIGREWTESQIPISMVPTEKEMEEFKEELENFLVERVKEMQ